MTILAGSIYFIRNENYSPSAESAVSQEDTIYLNPSHVEKHNFFKGILAARNPRILFIGDSITARWLNTGKTYWDSYFSPLGAADVGIEGETTNGLLWRIGDGEFDGIAPKKVVLMIGTNDIGLSITEIADRILTVVRRLRAALPAARITVIGILPREAPDSRNRAKVQSVNQILSAAITNGKVDKNIEFLDLGHLLLQQNGQFRDGLMMPDQLHLLAPAYDAIGQSLLAELAR